MQILRHELINMIIAIFRLLKWFGYIRCDIILSFFDGCCWSLSFPRAVSTLTFCASSAASTAVRRCNNVRHPWTFGFVHWRVLTSTQFIIKYGATSLPDKSAGVNDLRRRLTDEKVGVEQSVIGFSHDSAILN